MQIRLSLIPLLAVCVLSGCGEKRPANMPVLHPCTITITQGSSPLVDAVVSLAPVGGGLPQWDSSARTNSSGVATIMTHAKFPGAPAGAFKVLVTKEMQSPPTLPMPPKEADYGEFVAYNAHVSTQPWVRYVEKKYGNANETLHSITITKGKNTATFDVGEAIEEVMK